MIVIITRLAQLVNSTANHYQSTLQDLQGIVLME